MATFQSVAPIFPTADMDAMRVHYEALGFAVRVHGGGYGTAGSYGGGSAIRQCRSSGLLPYFVQRGDRRFLYKRQRQRIECIQMLRA